MVLGIINLFIKQCQLLNILIAKNIMNRQYLGLISVLRRRFAAIKFSYFLWFTLECISTFQLIGANKASEAQASSSGAPLEKPSMKDLWFLP